MRLFWWRQPPSSLHPFPPRLISKRLALYDSDALGDLRVIFLDALGREERRITALDGKANIVLGLGVALVGWLIPQLIKHPVIGAWETRGYLASLVLGAAAVIFAFLAFRARGGQQRLEDQTLFPRPSAAGFDLEATRRLWAHALRDMLEANIEWAKWKGGYLRLAQGCLILSVVVAVLALGVSVALRPPLPTLQFTHNVLQCPD